MNDKENKEKKKKDNFGLKISCFIKVVGLKITINKNKFKIARSISNDILGLNMHESWTKI